MFHHVSHKIIKPCITVELLVYIRNVPKVVTTKQHSNKITTATNSISTKNTPLPSEDLKLPHVTNHHSPKLQYFGISLILIIQE